MEPLSKVCILFPRGAVHDPGTSFHLQRSEVCSGRNHIRDRDGTVWEAKAECGCLYDLNVRYSCMYLVACARMPFRGGTYGTGIYHLSGRPCSSGRLSGPSTIRNRHGWGLSVTLSDKNMRDIPATVRRVARRKLEAEGLEGPAHRVITSLTSTINQRLEPLLAGYGKTQRWKTSSSRRGS
jgi:hypothetical protein